MPYLAFAINNTQKGSKRNLDRPDWLLRPFVLFSLLLLTACFDPGLEARVEAARQAHLARSIPEAQGQINNVTIRASEKELRQAFGTPLKVETGISEVVGLPSKTLDFQSAHAYLIGGELYEFRCFGRDCRSQVGVRIGDSYERVISLHQKGELEPREDGTFFLRYPISGSDTYLIYKIRDGQVFEMTVWFDYV